jgi:hypothetical protein
MSEMEDDNIDLFWQHRADQRKPSVAELVIDGTESKQPPMALFPEARGASPDRYAGRDGRGVWRRDGRGGQTAARTRHHDPTAR